MWLIAPKSLSPGAPCLSQAPTTSHPCAFPHTLPNPFSPSPSSGPGNTPCQSPATSSAGLATRMPSIPRLLPRGQRAWSLQARNPLHSSVPGMGCPTCKSQGWFLRVIAQQWYVVQSPVAWESSSSFPTPDPRLGTARELARNQDDQVSKLLLSPYPPVYSLGAA